MMGRRKTFLNSRKNPQIVSVRLIHLKKKQKRLIHLFGEKCLILWRHGGSTMSSRCKAKQRQVTKQDGLQSGPPLEGAVHDVFIGRAPKESNIVFCVAVFKTHLRVGRLDVSTQQRVQKGPTVMTQSFGEYFHISHKLSIQLLSMFPIYLH